MHKPEFSYLMQNPARLPCQAVPRAPPGGEAPYPQGFSAASCPYRAVRASSTRTVAGAPAGSGTGTRSS